MKKILIWALLCLTCTTLLAQQRPQLRLNEIMADPTPIVGLPNAEFIELFNASADTINTAGIVLADATGKTALPVYALPPKSYVILCSSTNLSKFAPFGAALAVKSFPSLNNSGEPLRLIDAKGMTIDSVFYTPNWHESTVKKAGGWTLERINPIDTCSAPAQNWASSVNSQGGTPGKENSRFSLAQPSEAPRLLQVLHDSLAWELVFSQKLDLYSIRFWATQQQVTLLESASSSIRIQLSLATGEAKYLEMNGLRNCYGQFVADTTILLALGAQPQYLDLVITEIMADPSPVQGLPDAEYVEILNRSTQYLSLSGVQFFAGNDAVNIGSVILPPQSRLLLVSEKWLSYFQKFGHVQAISLPNLSNEGENIGLLHQTEGLLHAVHYRNYWYGDAWKSEGGFSLEMLDTDFPCITEGNWLASQHLRGGTPAAVNSLIVNASDRTPPAILQILPNNVRQLELRFSEPLHVQKLKEASFWLGEQALGLAKYDAHNPSKLFIQLTDSLHIGEYYTLHFKGVPDCAQNVAPNEQTANFWMPAEADSGDVLLNELLPQPFVGGNRFVELINTSERPINLDGWQLCRMNEAGEIDRWTELAPEMLVLPPKSFMVFTADKANVLGNYPKGPIERIYETANELPVFGFEPEESKLLLRNKQGVVMDRVELSEEMTFSLIDEHAGVSLERVSVHAPTEQWSNWKSAATQVGYATPGQANSQQSTANINAGCWQLSPKVITPNQDGYQDFTSITACAQDYTVANLLIFDQQGRQVRHLAQQALLGSADFFTWDGTTDAGTLATTGLYIVYIEGFRLNGQIFREKLCVAIGF